MNLQQFLRHSGIVWGLRSRIEDLPSGSQWCSVQGPGALCFTVPSVSLLAPHEKGKVRSQREILVHLHNSYSSPPRETFTFASRDLLIPASPPPFPLLPSPFSLFPSSPSSPSPPSFLSRRASLRTVGQTICWPLPPSSNPIEAPFTLGAG